MQKNKKSVSTFLLTMICLSTILSIRNWPLTASYGISCIPLVIIAAALFLVPTALVSAELATMWSTRSGVYTWVSQSFGRRVGVFAIWLQWVENVIYYPLVLSFVSSTLAYVIYPPLAKNALYTFFVIISLFWSLTWINLKGIKTSSIISTIGVLLGTIIPGCLIVSLGVFWYYSSHAVSIDLNDVTFLPNISSFSELGLFSGIILGFAGMEMPAVHVNDVNNPKITYPKSIAIASILIVVLTILGSLSIATILPSEDISLTSGVVATVSHVLSSIGLSYLVPLFALLVAIGALGTVSTWIVGPTRGLLSAAEDGDFPPFFHKKNSNEMPVNLMIAQGVIVTFFASFFLFLPSVDATFYILVIMTSQLYLGMYVLLFAAAIRLKYTHKNVLRSYQVPFGRIGMWLISGVGCLTSLFLIGIGFMPPVDFSYGSVYIYEGILITGMFVFASVPFLISLYQKKCGKQL